MYCKVCGNNRDSIKVFNINMCKECFYEIGSITVVDEDYDRYKNLIRILLSNYIPINHCLNPVN